MKSNLIGLVTANSPIPPVSDGQKAPNPSPTQLLPAVDGADSPAMAPDLVQRRDFLKGAALFAFATTATLAGTRRAQAGDVSFMNTIPDPLLSGKELPTFKFELEKSKAKVIGKCSAREATVLRLPISTGIAGVSMKLEPGGMRELHWTPRPRSGPWCLKDGCAQRSSIRMAPLRRTISSRGMSGIPARSRSYARMPRGREMPFRPHLRQRLFLGIRHLQHLRLDRPCSETAFGKNFSLPESIFDGFPKDEVYFAIGAIPPEKPTAPLQGWKPSPLTHKYSTSFQPAVLRFQGWPGLAC